MRQIQINKRKSDRMASDELIDLARLLVLFASFVEYDRSAQEEELALALECIKRAQELRSDPTLDQSIDDLPF